MLQVRPGGDSICICAQTKLPPDKIPPTPIFFLSERFYSLTSSLSIVPPRRSANLVQRSGMKVRTGVGWRFSSLDPPASVKKEHDLTAL